MSFEKKSSRTKRYPLKRKPLHNPGESLQQEIDRLLSEDLFAAFAIAVLAIMIAVYEWFKWYFNSPPQPIPLTFVALMALGYLAYRFRAVRKRIRILNMARDGEKAVGQCLEQLRRQGDRVFHDIPGKGFNIDHVVVSPHGIFVIETKTFSKPASGNAVVKFDGEKLLINGMAPDRNAVTQAQALVHWLRDLLEESTGRRFPIKPVVVFPGWYVEPLPKPTRDFWVLNPKALQAFIENEPIILQPEDVALVSSRIINHVATHVE